MQQPDFRTLWACGLILCAAPQAHAIPSSLRDSQTGFVANVFQEQVRYDASTDLLAYSAQSRFDYSNRLCTNACVPVAMSFNGLFEWSAGVNELGVLTGPSSMRWYGDFGSGLELIASGEASRLQVTGPNIFPDVNVTQFSQLSTLFDLQQLDPRVAGMGNHIWFDFEYQFQRNSIASSLFLNDFNCGPGNTVSPDGSFRCSPFSTSGLIGLQVPEPGTLALLVLGLTGLGFARRRSR